MVSSVTTARWRPTREFALRVAPRLFTVMIPAAMIGAILAWVLAHEKASPPAPAPTPPPQTADEVRSGSAAAAASDAGAPAESAPANSASSFTGSDGPAPSLDAMVDREITRKPGSDGDQGSGEAAAPGASSPRGANADRRDAGSGAPPPRSPETPQPRQPTRSPGSSTVPGVENVDLSILDKAMSKQKDCSGVERACRAASAWPEHAFYCFYAACCKNDVKEARRLLLGNPGDHQSNLRADCKRMGNPDVGVRQLDCAHNIRDCKN